MDREAFNERFAILLAEELQHEHEIEQYRLQYLRFLAEQDAYNTLFARLATAAIRGDWTRRKSNAGASASCMVRRGHAS